MAKKFLRNLNDIDSAKFWLQLSKNCYKYEMGNPCHDNLNLALIDMYYKYEIEKMELQLRELLGGD